MSTYLEQDGFIKEVRDKLISEKSITIQSSLEVDHVIQLVSLIYSLKIQYFKGTLRFHEGTHFHYQIHLLQ